MIRQNPFSLYDFLGYFIPGVTFFFLILILKNESINSLNDIILVTSQKEEFKFDEIMISIVISYCLGHLISYFSSITVENFANWKYGYPSKYLLKIKLKNKYCSKKLAWQVKMFRVIIAVIILPVTIIDYFLFKWFLFGKYYLKPLDSLLINLINAKTTSLVERLSSDGKVSFSDSTDTHRIITHYVYENSKKHQSKLSNYVALYGFLRCLTLIACFLFWILFGKAIIGLLTYYKSFLFEKNFEFSIMDFDGTLFLYLMVISAVSYVYYMGFIKFYRRYTLEGFMALVVEKDASQKS